MKKILPVLAIVFFSFNSGIAQTGPIDTALHKLDFEKYLNKPMDSLLAAIPAFLPSQLQIEANPGSPKARMLSVTYPNQAILKMSPKRFNFMNPIDPKRVWDISLFRKEIVAYIELSYDGVITKDAVAP